MIWNIGISSVNDVSKRGDKRKLRKFFEENIRKNLKSIWILD